MKVAVIGSNGQLGTDVVHAFADNGDEVCGLTHADVEIANRGSVSNKLRELQADIVVNTAAMHHVENCESEPDRAFAVNALGSKNLALVARDIGSVLMHVSTDYVFDGSKGSPYDEGDPPTKCSSDRPVSATWFGNCRPNRPCESRHSARYD